MPEVSSVTSTGKWIDLPGTSGRGSRRIIGAVVGIALVLYVADAATSWTGPWVHGMLRDWFVLALYTVAAGLCVLRGIRVRADRVAWLLLGAGIALYAGGTVVFLAQNVGPTELNAPLPSNALWLAFYPAAIGGVVLLVAARAPRFPLGAWLDAAAAALSLTALLAVIALPGVEHLQRKTVAAGATFPALDIILLTLSLWVLSLTRWRPHRSWVLMTVAFALLAVADTGLALRAAAGVYVRGELVSTCYPLAMITLGVAAAQRPAPRLSEPMVSLRVLFLPGAAALTAAGLLAAYVAHPFSRLPAALAVAAICVGFIRAAGAVSEVRGLYESRRYARGFHDSALGVALVGWDMCWLRVNPALCEMLRYSADDLVGHSVLEVTYEEDLRSVEAERARCLANPHRATFQKRYVRSDGAVVDVEITTSLIHDEVDGTYFYSQIQDISDRRRAERRQALIADLGSRALDIGDVGSFLQQVVETASEALDVVACALLTTAGENRFEYVAHTGPRADPYPSNSMAGWALSQRRAIVSNDLAGDARFSVRPDAVGVIDRGIAVPVHTRDPYVLVVGASVNRDPFESEDAHFLEALAHIAGSVLERAATDQELRRMALVDRLTGLANRTSFEHHLSSALEEARRLDHTIAVLLLAVDNFKFVNDAMGYPAGDQLLREIADRLRQTVPDEHMVARLGGDEFVAVCSVPRNEVNVPRLADRLLSVLDDPFMIAGQNLHVSASVGVALSNGRESSAAEMLQNADIAMYRAKSQPGSGYEVFDTELRQQILARVQVERELREALRCDGQLTLHYQPIVDLRTRVIRGFEALVRWNHPRDGLLTPDVFLQIAEDSGLILRLGEQMLHAACARVAHWSDLGNSRPYVSFNLSARQLTPDVPGMMARCVERHGAEFDQLTVEVTEHALLNPDVAVPVLRELRDMGIAVALDDFGAGYSSLSSLEMYPLDAIKLDRGFVVRARDPRSAKILRAAVEMGSALGLDVIAEGIEHEEERELLLSLGCTFGQGYLFARPLPAEDADALVASRILEGL